MKKRVEVYETINDINRGRPSFIKDATFNSRNDCFVFNGENKFHQASKSESPLYFFTPLTTVKIAKPLIRNHYVSGTPLSRKALVIYAMLRYKYRHGRIDAYTPGKASKELGIPDKYFRTGVKEAIRLGLLHVDQHGGLQAITNNALDREHKRSHHNHKITYYTVNAPDKGYKEIEIILFGFAIQEINYKQDYVVQGKMKALTSHKTVKGYKKSKKHIYRNDTIGKQGVAPLLQTIIGLRKISKHLGISKSSAGIKVAKLEEMGLVKTAVIKLIHARGYDYSEYTTKGYNYYSKAANATVMVIGTRFDFFENSTNNSTIYNSTNNNTIHNQHPSSPSLKKSIVMA